MLVDFVHQDFEAAIHDLVDFLRIKLLGKGGEVRHIGEQHGHQLPLTFDGAPVGQNLIGQMFRGVGLRFGVVYLTDFFRFFEVASAFTAKFKRGRIREFTFRTDYFQPGPALTAKFNAFRILKPALYALHDIPHSV
jgi:hypothetical protein